MYRAFIPFVMMLAGVTPGQAQQAPAPETQQNAASGNAQGVISPVLTIDSERLFRDSAFGSRVSREIEAQSEQLATENREIEAELEAEERELTEKRTQMTPAAFRVLADAFDEKVQRTRAEQASKNRALSEALDLERDRFLAAAAPVMEQLMRNSDAAVILERRRVFVSSSAIEVTDQAISLLDETIGDGLTEAD
ncbi:hypothetical protein DSM110093_01387 [Sulfitobacter sp. DSM 110093]|uniref:OmpH family outer membrane protein n=1 Tax=Sulfitobacter sp. DSM 110093 TaxID=2883127 RepID=UPI001FAD8B24|nr:OmpH family outer membrane protein [Sulfitobacter sp. DSM 110093]UOA31616.1 hypothetical protein DSM110093_01387 [Sulfitobacter sp. DSM 110093]